MVPAAARRCAIDVTAAHSRLDVLASAAGRASLSLVSAGDSCPVLRNAALRRFAAIASSSDAPPTPSPGLGTYVSGPTTHFGYESVPTGEKAIRVRRVFEGVADSYDVMNDVLSAGLHRHWKDELLRMTGVAPLARALRRRVAAARRQRARAADDGGDDDGA